MKRGFISLRQKDPDMAAQWVSGERPEQDPDTVSCSSHVRAMWRCGEGHLFTASVNNRILHRSSCPYCSGKKVLRGFNDLETVDPALAEQWHPYRNGDLMPDEVLPGSNLKVWWKCSLGHTWAASVNNRSKGSGCPYCTGKTPVRMHFV